MEITPKTIIIKVWSTHLLSISNMRRGHGEPSWSYLTIRDGFFIGLQFATYTRAHPGGEVCDCNRSHPSPIRGSPYLSRTSESDASMILVDPRLDISSKLHSSRPEDGGISEVHA